MMKLIITGASGMVGEEVLQESLKQDSVSSVVVIGRRHCGIVHPKLKEVIHSDFFNLDTIDADLKGYDACLFCLGVSSVGMKEAEFFKMTHTLTMNFAKFLYQQNPEMLFCYISGAGTDTSEKGRQMWARVKGKTENDLQQIGFKGVYLFRPGYLQPSPGMKNTLKYYRYIKWMYPFLNAVVPGYVSTLQQLAKAMLYVSLNGYRQRILEVKEIRAAAAMFVGMKK
jgi:uncharacterized protein YbjT (DUF2867 family)